MNDEIKKNILIKTFDDCVGGEIELVRIATFIGIIQWLGFFFQIFTQSKQINLLWVIDNQLFNQFPMIFLVPIGLFLGIGIIYSLIYLIVLAKNFLGNIPSK